MKNNAEEAFTRAYEEFADAIFRHCIIRVRDRDLATDLTQECFVRTWKYLAKGKEVRNFRAFLYRVANNLIVDYSRKKTLVSLDTIQEEKGFEIEADENPRDTHEVLDGKELMHFLNHLPEDYRIVVTMRYIDGLKPKEIAEVLGETQNRVSVRIHRGVKKLRALVAEEIHNGNESH